MDSVFKVVKFHISVSAETVTEEREEGERGREKRESRQQRSYKSWGMWEEQGEKRRCVGAEPCRRLASPRPLSKDRGPHGPGIPGISDHTGLHV